MPTDIRSQLLPDEKKELAHFEDVIQKGINTFFAVGEALQAIKRAKLYRGEYPTFEEYCAVRWGIGARRVGQIVDATKAVETVKSGTMVRVLPENERQARPLTALEPIEQVAAWEKAVEIADGEQPTAAQVTEAVQFVRPGPVGAQPTGADVVASEPVGALDRALSQNLSQMRPGEIIIPGDAFQETHIFDEWAAQMEEALRSIQDNGLVPTAGGVRCISGCRASRVGETYVHEDDCLLGNVLEQLKISDQVGGKSQ